MTTVHRLFSGVLCLVVVTACAQPDGAAPYLELDRQTAASRETFEAIAVPIAEAYRLVADVDGTSAELLRTGDGVWRPGEGATSTAAGLLAEVQDLYFPVLSYRRLDVDRNDPQFGLVHPRAVVTIETRTAQTFELSVGDLTLTGGGYYAAVSGDPAVYIVIPQVYDYAVSFVAGKRVERPPDPKFVQALDRIEATSDPEEVINPWLKQVVDVQGD